MGPTAARHPKSPMGPRAEAITGTTVWRVPSEEQSSGEDGVKATAEADTPFRIWNPESSRASATTLPPVLRAFPYGGKAASECPLSPCPGSSKEPATHLASEPKGRNLYRPSLPGKGQKGRAQSRWRHPPAPGGTTVGIREGLWHPCPAPTPGPAGHSQCCGKAAAGC